MNTKKKKAIVVPAQPVDPIEKAIQDFYQWYGSRPPLPEPTRFFEVGQEIVYGGHRNCHVVDIIDNGMGYVLHYDYIDDRQQRPHKVGYTSTTWLNVFPMSPFHREFSQEDDLRIVFLNADISSLLSYVYTFGVDFDPPYQRELVWTHEKKIALLDSIFSNVDIGKFTLNSLGFSEERIFKLYQIIDGKQRLTTLCEFYEGRLAYRGKFYHEMTFADRMHFDNFPVVRAELRNATEQQVLKLFVRLNTTGTPMDQKHLERVKAMIEC